MINPTAQTILKATLETLREEGFAGATSRAIARRAGCNQALIFYHFGSLENLLVTAMQQTSDERLTRYREAVAPIATLDALLPVMAALWEEDKQAGHVQIVAQVIAGSANRPELCSQVVEMMKPWTDTRRGDLRPRPAARPPRPRARPRHRRLVPRRQPPHLPRPCRDADRHALRARAAVDAARRATPRHAALTCPLDFRSPTP